MDKDKSPSALLRAARRWKCSPGIVYRTRKGSWKGVHLSSPMGLAFLTKRAEYTVTAPVEADKENEPA